MPNAAYQDVHQPLAGRAWVAKVTWPKDLRTARILAHLLLMIGQKGPHATV